jgi:two-component system cell cycle sensor histidine kinase/response regulator CckA
MNLTEDLLSKRPERMTKAELIGALEALRGRVQALEAETRRDMKSRKRAEAAMHQSEQHLASIVASAMDGIITIGPDHRIILFNKAAESMFGYDAAEVIGRPISLLLPMRFRSVHDAHIARFGATGETNRAMGRLGAVSGVRRDGAEFPIEASISQTEADGEKFFTVILRDQTETIQANERLIEQAALLDQSNEAIVVRDLEGCIRYWSRGAERLYGWAAEEVVGRMVAGVLYRRDSSMLNEATRITVERGEWSGELRHTARDGREVVVEGHWTLVRDSEDRPKSILAINTDITEKKKIEAHLLRAQRLESIGTLASGIAHDLNNILSPIMMGTQLLQMRLGDEESRRMLSVMQSNAKRGAEMIRQVLMFARGMGGARVILQPRHLVREIARIVEETFPKSISIEQRLAEDLWTVVGDATQLHQVLLNLCVNARDAMPEGGILAIGAENRHLDGQYAGHLGRTFENAAPGNYVVLAVSDTGVGIPGEILDRIFDPFFTTKAPGQGTGLGLATAEGIIANHGGFITVESKQGFGTVFSIFVPAYDSSTRQQSDDPALDIQSGSGEMILVIDDEASSREMMTRALETYGYKTLAADNGANALNLFAPRRGVIRAVITDMAMPVMDGAATINALRRLQPNIPIIAITGLADASRLKEISDLRVDALLEKPFDAEALLNAVSETLR